MTCTCVSKRPGRSVEPLTSTCSSPSSPTPTSAICPSTTATSASASAAPVPSKTRPPANTVLTWGSFRSLLQERTSLSPPIAIASPVEQPTLHRLEQISPRAFQHPAHRAATAALSQIPGVDQVVRNLIELKYER